MRKRYVIIVIFISVGVCWVSPLRVSSAGGTDHSVIPAACRSRPANRWLFDRRYGDEYNIIYYYIVVKGNTARTCIYYIVPYCVVGVCTPLVLYGFCSLVWFGDKHVLWDAGNMNIYPRKYRSHTGHFASPP